MSRWWCSKNNAPEVEVGCSWKDQNRGACVTRGGHWCPFFMERKPTRSNPTGRAQDTQEGR